MSIFTVNNKLFTQCWGTNGALIVAVQSTQQGYMTANLSENHCGLLVSKPDLKDTGVWRLFAAGNIVQTV